MTKDMRLQISVSELDIPVRVANSLQEHGVFTVENLLYKTPQQIVEMKNVSDVSLSKIYKALAKLGFHRQKVSN